MKDGYVINNQPLTIYIEYYKVGPEDGFWKPVFILPDVYRWQVSKTSVWQVRSDHFGIFISFTW